MTPTNKTIISDCPCSSSKSFRDCCQPLLLGEKVAKTPLALMRSRYCAYYLGGYGDYLFKTWLAKRRQALSADELSIKTLRWCRLEIVSKEQAGNYAFVEFKAYFEDVTGAEQVHHERSRFERVAGLWFYDQAVG